MDEGGAFYDYSSDQFVVIPISFCTYIHVFRYISSNSIDSLRFYRSRLDNKRGLQTQRDYILALSKRENVQLKCMPSELISISLF